MRWRRDDEWYPGIILLLLAVGGLLIGGCGTPTLSPEAVAVRITANPEAVRGCTLMGEVRGKSNWGGLLYQKAGEERARGGLRNAAVALGANVVLIETALTGFSGSKIRGEAYWCVSPGSPIQGADGLGFDGQAGTR